MTVMMTVDLLQALGSCGGYVDTFRHRFPESNYPDGVEITPEVCVANADGFDWSWAAEVMLTPPSYRQWRDRVSPDGDEARALRQEREALRRERREWTAAWRERGGESDAIPSRNTTEEQRAAWTEANQRFDAREREVVQRINTHSAQVFGELFAVPDNRSERVLRDHAYVEEVRESRRTSAWTTQINQASETRATIERDTRERDNLTRRIKANRDRLPEQEAAAREATIKLNEYRVERANRQVQAAAEALERLQAVAKERADELAASLAASSAESAAEEANGEANGEATDASSETTAEPVAAS